MREEILFVVIVLVVAALMVVDVARTRDEGLHGQAEGHAFDAKRPIAAPSLGGRESFSRANFGSAMPVAVHDAGPARHPAGPGPSAGADPRSHANAAAVPRGSRRRLRDWHVRSRLVLLVIIPLAAAAVIALCVSYIIDVRHGAHANSNGSVLSALAAGVAIIVAVLTLWFTIAVARSVLRPLHRLRMGALELAGPAWRKQSTAPARTAPARTAPAETARRSILSLSTLTPPTRLARLRAPSTSCAGSCFGWQPARPPATASSTPRSWTCPTAASPSWNARSVSCSTWSMGSRTPSV